MAAPELRLAGDARRPRTPTQTPTPEDPRTGLRAVVIGLVGRGLRDEAALVARSRVLRARIENPTGVDAGAEPEISGRPVTEVVEESLLATAQGSAVRTELLRWVGPGLSAAAGQLGTKAQELPPAEVRVGTVAGTLTVTPEGLAPARLAQAEATLTGLHSPGLSRVLAPGLVTGVLVVQTLVAALTNHPRGAWLALFGSVLAALILGYLLLDRRRAHRRRAEVLGDLRRRLAEARQEAQEQRWVQQETAAEATRLAEAVRERLRPAG